MKQIIVLVAMIAIGIFIFQMVAGDGENSMKSTVKTVWQHEIKEKVRQEP